MAKQARYKLNLQLFGGDKTEKATPKKRQDARKKGQVAKSAEMSGAVVLFSALLSLELSRRLHERTVYQALHRCVPEPDDA